MSQPSANNATVGHPGDDMAGHVAKSEWLCRAVAGRDLANVPLYIVPQSSLPKQAGSAKHCYGYTTPSLDLYLRDHISGWRGRGPCMVINDIALAQDFATEDLDYATAKLVLHELAHILDRPVVFAERRDAPAAKIKFEAMVVADAGERPPREELPRYFGHEFDFIRVCLHLVFRAQRIGLPIKPAALCAGFRYGLSHASEYAEALDDEPARCVGMLFREIAATSPPPAFLQLWIQDMVSYEHRFSLLKGVPK
jgi:hypothetical protein